MPGVRDGSPPAWRASCPSRSRSTWKAVRIWTREVTVPATRDVDAESDRDTGADGAPCLRIEADLPDLDLGGNGDAAAVGCQQLDLGPAGRSDVDPLDVRAQQAATREPRRSADEVRMDGRDEAELPCAAELASVRCRVDLVDVVEGSREAYEVAAAVETLV